MNWTKEARDMGPDPVSGAMIVRLSGSSIRTENIYCESPRASSDGRRIATFRYIDEIATPEKWLVCHDVETKLTCGLDDKVIDSPIAPAWGGAVYYRRGTELRKVSLETGEITVLLDMRGLPPCAQLYSVSPDQRFLLYSTVVSRNPLTLNLARLDLQEETCELLLDDSWKAIVGQDGLDRIGAEYNPVTGKEILIGAAIWKKDRSNRYGVGFIADADARNPRQVFANLHHSAYMANSGWIAGLGMYDYARCAHLPETPDGELALYATDGKTPPRPVPMREHILYHLSSSRCGRYLVGEGLEGGFNGPVPLVVVNPFTGKHRVLVQDCRCSPAGDCGRQAKPYFTATNRHVIYTADPDGIVNVFSAEIPKGFLESLD